MSSSGARKPEPRVQVAGDHRRRDLAADVVLQDRLVRLPRSVGEHGDEQSDDQEMGSPACGSQGRIRAGVGAGPMTGGS